MRQFVLAKGAASGSIENMSDGQVGVFYKKDGIDTLSTDGTEFKKGNLVLFRDNEHGGPILFPVHRHHFSYVRGDYQEATKFKATIEIPTPTVAGDYSVIVVLNGVKFNERNKWTSSIHLTSKSVERTSAEDLTQKLADHINGTSAHGTMNVPNHGVVATVDGTTLTIEAVKSGIDYTILGADELFDVKAEVESKGLLAYGDAKYVQDLAEKCAADMGFEYTYRDAYYYLYPYHPINPLRVKDDEDKGFTIFTIRFAEPRDVSTHDHNVNQIVQIALPTGDDGIEYLDKVFAGMAGETTTTAVTPSNDKKDDETIDPKDDEGDNGVCPIDGDCIANPITGD